MENRRGLWLLVTVVAVSLAATALVSQEKGGGDETGPYNLVANWPQNPCGPGFRVGSTGGIFAETPDRVFIFQRGCLPVVDERYVRHPAGPRADAQRRQLRPLVQGSQPPSPLGPRPLHRQPRRQDDRFLGAAQPALRAAAQGPHQPLRSREARVARRRWGAADLQADQRRQEDRADARRVQGRGQRRQALRAPHRHRVAARRHVLRHRRLHEHARR